MRKILVLLLIVALIAAGVFFATRKKPVAVGLHTVAEGTVELTVSNTRAGTVKACRRSKIAPAVGGQVAGLALKEGDFVRKGQVLLELWNKDLDAARRLAEGQVLSSLSSRDEVCLTAERARRSADRLTELAAQGIAAKESLDQAVSEADALTARCRAAESQVEVARRRVTEVRAQLERTIIRAPFDGWVAELNSEVGEFVTPSPPGIATLPAIDLIDTTCLYVSAPIDEVDSTPVKVGLPARITLDSFPGKSFRAEVKRISPYVLEIEKQARTVEVEAAFLDPGEAVGLRPGFSADVEIILDTRPNVLRVPSDAMLEGNRVLVRRPEDGVLEERKLEVGLTNWNFTEVRSGLKAGEEIVMTVHREGVKAGVKTVPDTPTTPSR